ncbi:glycosyltransferase family 2 protein [Pseudomonas sp. MBLB4123]|uniref:glycosyltransferase family 2 protein n=1 Tax=Pseudomonas sp. MBLB4123 TaxID=3451557 RepID=UPI003F751E59
MIFSADSDITVVVTSCGRFDLLRRTLESLDRCNSAPIRAVFITEDSGSAEVESCIPEHWRLYTRFWINNPRLGQLRSIDAAYAAVETPWIFHCEDDWDFYRPGFIEDSRRLLEHDPQALQVWLRSAAHDLALHSPYVYLGERQLVDGIAFYRVCSRKAEWQGFSFNPGLRRLKDYQAYAPYAQYSGEKELSALYAERPALILENDAVLHTGFGEHVSVPEERSKKAKRKRLDRVRLLLVFAAGLLLGWWI